MKKHILNSKTDSSPLKDKFLKNLKAEYQCTSSQLEDFVEVYEMNYQWTNIFYDQNVEAWGWNRQQNEGRLSHLMRLLKNNFYSESSDHSLYDLSPCGSLLLNDLYETHPETYYFSYTFGYKEQIRTKQRE